MTRWRSWDARLDSAGPWHVRLDSPNGKTVIWWNGSRQTLGDHHLEDLVYVAGDLELGEQLVIGEGEKSADAIAAAGYQAAGTVCGASSTPGLAVVAFLARFPVILWPDNDDVGRAHMGRLGWFLERAQVPRLAIVRPPVDAPTGWDAADAPAWQVRELVDAAARRTIGPVAA
jgi:putative DNA primase/helicase